MTYPGGKNGAGAYQRIINYMPPHATYIEMFLGSGAIMRHKRPAARNIGIDRSLDALDICLNEAGDLSGEFHLLHGNALDMLPALSNLVIDTPFVELRDTLVYADPPYMMATRKGGELYDFEMTDPDHARLLEMLKSARCMVMISGYRSALYDDELSGWTRIDYAANTRRGLVSESLWMNFAPPVTLHDYTHLGANYRERERIKRKKERWRAKLAQMPRLERLAIMEVLSQQTDP